MSVRFKGEIDFLDAHDTTVNHINADQSIQCEPSTTKLFTVWFVLVAADLIQVSSHSQ